MSGSAQGGSHGTSSHGTNSHETNSHETSSHGTNSHSTNSHETSSHGTNSHSTNSQGSGLRMTQRGIAAAVVVLACVGLAFVMPYLLSRYYSWQGDRLQARGNLTAAASAYRHALKADSSPAVLDKLGLVYSKERLPGRALEVLKTAVAMAPGDPRTHSKLGLGLAAAGQVPAARQELAQALAINANDPTAHLALSDLDRSEGRIAEADQELEQAIEDGADTPEAHLRMGELYLARHDPRAEKEFQAVVRLDPLSGAAHLRLGYLLMDSDPDRAASELQLAIDDSLLSVDDRARALAARAALAYQADRPDDARTYLSQAAALRPDPDVLAVLDFSAGITRRDSGDMVGAFHAFTAAIAENPHVTAFRTGLLVGGASLYGAALDDFRDGRLDDSEISLRSLIELAPRNPEFTLLLSQVQSARGDTTGAIKTLRRVAAAAPRDPEVWLDLSSALFQAGRSQESSNALKEALHLAPLWTQLRPDVDMLLGKLDLASNRPQQAQACFEFAAASHSPMVNAQECSALYQQAAERVAEIDATHSAEVQVAVDQAAATQAAIQRAPAAHASPRPNVSLAPSRLSTSSHGLVSRRIASHPSPASHGTSGHTVRHAAEHPVQHPAEHPAEHPAQHPQSAIPVPSPSPSAPGTQTPAPAAPTSGAPAATTPTPSTSGAVPPGQTPAPAPAAPSVPPAAPGAPSKQ